MDIIWHYEHAELSQNAFFIIWRHSLAAIYIKSVYIHIYKRHTNADDMDDICHQQRSTHATRQKGLEKKLFILATDHCMEIKR